MSVTENVLRRLRPWFPVIWLVLVVLLGLVTLRGAHRANGPGTRAEWYAAGVGGLALALIGLALLYQVQTEQARVDEQRKAAARKVFAVFEGGTKVGERYEVTATLFNGSDEVVYQGRISVLPWRWTEGDVPLLTQAVPALLPRSSSEPVYFNPVPPPPANLEYDGFETGPPLVLELTDGANVRWRRWPDGHLVEVKLPGGR